MPDLHVQLRVDTKSPKEAFEWAVVALGTEGSVEHVLVSGKSSLLAKVLEDGGAALIREAWAPEPARYEWECPCGAGLSIEARRSRRSPYSWDTPREITCNCGRAWGVKLTFITGRVAPTLEALPRDR